MCFQACFWCAKKCMSISFYIKTKCLCLETTTFIYFKMQDKSAQTPKRNEKKKSFICGEIVGACVGLYDHFVLLQGTKYTQIYTYILK